MAFKYKFDYIALLRTQLKNRGKSSPYVLTRSHLSSYNMPHSPFVMNCVHHYD